MQGDGCSRRRLIHPRSIRWSSWSRFFRSSAQHKQIIRVSKITQQVSDTQGPAEDCISQDEIAANHCDRLWKCITSMTSTTSTQCRWNSTRSSRTPYRERTRSSWRRLIRCDAKATFTAFRPCRNRGRATRVRHLPSRYVTKSANDAKGTESGEHCEDFLRCSTPTRSSKIPVTVQKLMLKEQKEHPDILCFATHPVHNEKTQACPPTARHTARCRKDGTASSRGLIQQKDELAKFKSVGTPACNARKKRQE